MRIDPDPGTFNPSLRQRGGAKKKKRKRKGLLLAEEAQVKGQEAALESKPALSRVLLQQGHDRLNLAGNFANDSFNSLADEATGGLTMVTVYYDFDNRFFGLRSPS